MKLQWGKKVSCPACAMRLYDLTNPVVTCPYCGNVFEPNDYRSKKKGGAGEDFSKGSGDFDFDTEALEEETETVLEGDEIDNDIEVIKIKEFD